MKPTRIVLHHSLTNDSKTVSWQAIRRYHMETLGWRNIGYHYGLEQIGTETEILLGRMINERGAHCKKANDYSIGICFVGNFDIEKPSDALWVAGLKLVKSLIEVIGISSAKVFGHREYDDYKSCPGKLFSMDRFRSHLQL